MYFPTHKKRKKIKELSSQCTNRYCYNPFKRVQVNLHLASVSSHLCSFNSRDPALFFKDGDLKAFTPYEKYFHQ